ncbi:DUF3788 family protein [Breznakiella homolactica]|uniref:DUF3788 family protein n=1 Tax=Breznakiella homolactica TaxID=2798577 RepID=A0A7T8B8Q3_9SPIR|nr:DUF3788 family protein [Breznakiella homolactica]QQO08854.1 DUF3788 domain-containing protein [Breznakiella homolactica]
MKETQQPEGWGKRLLDGSHQPAEPEIRDYLGPESCARLERLEAMFRECYDLSRSVNFPFGSSYGWAYRYTHKKALLLYVFFEEGRFCCTISVGGKNARRVEALRDTLSPKARKLWDDRYPCGDGGGWIHYTVDRDNQLGDILAFTQAKVPPRRNSGK